MTYVVTTPPASEPIEASAVRESYLNVTDSTEEAYIDTLISTVVDYYERQFDKAIVSQTITEKFHKLSECMSLTVSPVISVSSMTYINDLGASVPMVENTDFYVTKSTIDAKIVLAENFSATLKDRPDAVTVVYTAGYATVPENIKQSIMEKVARLYYMREDNTEMAMQTVFSSAYMLFHPERRLEV